MKRIGLRLLSVLAGVFILLSSFCSVCTVSAASSNYKFDFESYKLGYPQISYKGVGLTNDSFEGKKALEFDFSKDKQKYAILAENKKASELQKGSIYTVSFNYKILGEIKADFSMSFYSSLPSSPLAAKYRQKVKDIDNFVTADTEINQWYSVTTQLIVDDFIVKGTEECDALAIGIISNKENNNTKIIIDNVVVTYKEELVYKTITFDSNGGSDIAAITSFRGDKIVWPAAPKKENQTFIGWYTEKDCKNLFTGKTYTDDIKLYAKYADSNADNIVLNFDDANFGVKSYQAAFRDLSISGADKYLRVYRDDYVSQGNALLYKDVLTSGVNRNFFLENGDKITLSDNTVYKVTFDYKVLSGSGGFSLYSSVKSTSAEVSYHKTVLTKTDDWKKITYYFKTDTLGDIDPTGESTNPVSRWLGITSYSDSNSNLLNYLMDNVTVTKLETTEDPVVVFNNYDGEASTYQIGKVGSEILISTPKRDGYTFKGWYTNLLEQVTFTDTVFSADAVASAKWVKSKQTQDFESYNHYGRGEGYDMDYEIYRNGVTQNFKKDFVHSGNTSIHRIGGYSGLKAVSMYDYSIEPLASNETYLFSFYVKLESCNDAKGAIHFANTKSLVVGWRFDEKYTPVVEYGELLDGKWHKISFISTVFTPYMALFTTGEASLYIDDFSIELVPAGTVLDESRRVGVGEGTGTPVVVGNHSVKNSLMYLEKWLQINIPKDPELDIIDDTEISDEVFEEITDDNDGPRTEIIKVFKPKPKNEANIGLIIAIISGSVVVLGVIVFFVVRYIIKRRRNSLET